MISSKVGTQGWSKAVQNHDFGDQALHLEAATPSSKGGDGVKDIGEKLNQIANPGGKEVSQKVRRAHNTLDKDDFLKLMLTQMKNQDPMNPMQSHEMAAQLAQFTSLEQLFNVNKNLENLGKAQDPMQKFEALNFLGKAIKADTRQIFRQAGDQATDLRFNLGTDAAKVKVTVADELGATVKIIEYGGLKAGANKIVWNGVDSNNRDVKPGKYIFNVEAETTAGHKVAVMTETKGTITGINYTPEGPMLMVGDQKVRIQDVQRIEDDSLKEKQNTDEAMRSAAPTTGKVLQKIKGQDTQAANHMMPEGGKVGRR